MIPKDGERLNHIRKALHENQLDALVLFHPDNIVMASGMLPGSTHVAVIVTADSQVVVITPWWRESFVQEESWADAILCFDWCRGFNGVEPISAMKRKLAEVRAKLGIESVGYDARMHHYSPCKLASELFTYDEVKVSLSEIFRFAKDANMSISALKAIKTAHEVDCLRRTQLVAKSGVEAFYDHAREGIRECDLAAEVNRSVLRMVGEQGIRYTYCDPPQITSGAERTSIADTMSNHATARQLCKGDWVMIEFGVQADGYWADITRTLIVGGPGEKELRIHEAIIAAQENAIRAYRPGSSTGDTLCRAAWDVMTDRGFGDHITHFLGHGLGFAYHEDQPTLGPESMSPIEPGNVTSIEPGLYLKGQGGMRVEDNVVWGNAAGQATVLSDFHRGLAAL